MSKFKVGDKVRYIEHESDTLVHGEVYTVSKLDGENGIYLKECNQFTWWWDHRFVLANQYSVKQVLDAYISAYNIELPEGTLEQVIDKVEQECERISDPEYLKYLELKKKFEN